MKHDLRWLLNAVHPVALVVVVGGCALTGAAVGALRAIARDYSRPHTPKGTPPS